MAGPVWDRTPLIPNPFDTYGAKTMGFLARLFGAVPKEELKGISLGEDAYWRVAPGARLPAFLRALPRLAPEAAILYLEGGSPPEDIKAFLDERCVPESVHLAMGTIWPRPEVVERLVRSRIRLRCAFSATLIRV